MSDLQWHTEKRKISDLNPFAFNPRQMTDKQAQDLAKSLDKFNLVEIPAINTNNTIIAGHQRIKLLIRQGRTDEEIDVRVPSRSLTDEEFKEYNLRSNKNTGGWDWDVLANNYDIPMLEDVGFTAIELGLGQEEDIAEEIEELRPFKRTHILLSFVPELMIKIERHLNEIVSIPGVEVEQGSN